MPKKLKLPQCCEAPGCDRKPRSRVGGVAYCSLHRSRVRKFGSTELPEKSEPHWSTCSLDGCSNPARTRYGSLCEKHYYRQYLHGSTDAPVRPDEGPRLGSHRYMYTYDKTHPLSPTSGILYEHRRVLYDDIGPGPHSCFWCGCEIDWGAEGTRKLVVDHQDNNKQNNDLGNLEPSCHRCNANRGLFMSWVIQHKDDPFLRRLMGAATNPA